MKHEDLPFDLRVLTQKNLQHNWETTGVLGRVAAPGKIITNIHGGGRLATFEELVLPHLHQDGFKKLRTELYRLGIHTAVQLQTSFPRLKEIGIDIALDEAGRPWILEVNTLPGIYAFGLLPDKETYRKIKRYAMAYGRLPSKKGRAPGHPLKHRLHLPKNVYADNKGLWRSKYTPPVFTSQYKKGALSGAASNMLNVEVFHVFCIFLDKVTTRFNVIPHQGVKHGISQYGIINRYLHHGPALRIHRRFPQLSAFISPRPL